MFGHAIAWLWVPLLLVFLLGPWRRAWRRPWYRNRVPRGWRDGVGEDREGEARSQQRQQQVDELETRVAELESRLDFAERLLAQRREAPVLPEQLPR